MVDRRQLIGNEIRAGGQQLRPTVRRANRAVVANYEAMHARRQQLIRLAAEPPRLPLPAGLAPAVPDTPTFNQFAYSLLLIALLAAISVGTNLINWAFLVYGLLAVAARLPSSQMFVAALLCLVIIPLTTALHREPLANTFAVMTFYFLVIGLIRAALELRRDNRKLGKGTPTKKPKRT